MVSSITQDKVPKDKKINQCVGVLTTVPSDGLMSRQKTNLYWRPMNVILVDGASLNECALWMFEISGSTDNTSSSSLDVN